MNLSKYQLKPQQLKRIVDPKIFKFKDTSKLSSLNEIIGQERASDAINFGINIKSPGYHIFALGDKGTGKRSIIKRFLKEKAKHAKTPDDWVYVNNFDEPDKPKAINFPAGLGCIFKDRLDNFVENLEENLPHSFEQDEYKKHKDNIRKSFENKRKEKLNKLRENAKQKGFEVSSTILGIIISPIYRGKPLSPEELENLSNKEKQEISSRKEEVEEEFNETLDQIQNLHRQEKEAVRKLDTKLIESFANPLIEKIIQEFKNNKRAVIFLNQVKKDIADKASDLKSYRSRNTALPAMLSDAYSNNQLSLNDYRVNLIVNNCDIRGAPVIIENNPNYHNLIGRIEHEARFGALVTNFKNIKAGALHKANGGYLIVDINDLLLKPFAWEALKRTLRSKKIVIEMPGEDYFTFVTKSLQPEPIPLNVKVVITGEPLLYYLLYSLDKDTEELIKVKADFNEQTDWEENSPLSYAKFIHSVSKKEGLRNFSPGGTAKIIEQASRMVDNQKKLTTKFTNLRDLIREADYWSKTNGNKLIEAEDVEKAVEEKIYRSNKIDELIQEMIDESTLLISTEGLTVGQVNGISVMQLGDYMFGKPSRITVSTYVGKQGLVNIDREAKLGGKIHNKGALILSGYLGNKYAQNEPLALSARITFEQLYEEVEGDSASSAELYALLSSLSGYPIKQNLAVTGSVNQKGEVQAIGGVNEKIEGFYKTCQHKGFTGNQGVVIPQANIKNLVLKDEVIKSVKKGKFHVYAIKTIDEGIEILTGKPAGRQKKDGTYPKNTVNFAVQKKIKALAGKYRKYVSD